MKSFFKVLVLTAVFSGTAICGYAQKGVQLVRNDAQRKVDVLFNGKLFTSYFYPVDVYKPVLYPIYTSGGTEITRGFPLNPRPFENPDHPHHIGSWLNFGDVNGLDFWNNTPSVPADKKKNFGTILHRSIVSMKNGSKQAVLKVTCDWVDHTGKVLLKEETTYIFGGKGDWRTIERITKLTAQQETVTFTDNKEGMIAIRMDRAFEEPTGRPANYLDAQGKLTKERTINDEGKNGHYRNSEGQEKESGVWGKPAKWVSLSAKKDAENITVAIIDHKKNWGHPAHSHARGYGLFSTNNMGNRSLAARGEEDKRPLFVEKLNPGQSTTMKHLIVIKTNGFATDAELNKMFADFNK